MQTTTSPSGHVMAGTYGNGDGSYIYNQLIASDDAALEIVPAEKPIKQSTEATQSSIKLIFADLIKTQKKESAIKVSKKGRPFRAKPTTDKKVSAAVVLSVAEIENFFKTLKYNLDAHNKHVFGHNDYKPPRSVWTHKDPLGLLKQYAGKGHRERGQLGLPNYKETVDFKEQIGIYNTPDGKVSLPTSRGTIHYGKKGGHIVPAQPSLLLKA